MSDAKPGTVAAVVVTFNRKELLSQCLEGLLAQTRPVDVIYVIDNASTDGTAEMVAQRYAGRVTYQCLPENTGGAGGFHHGTKRAYDDGHDWIWEMDDDALPQLDALEVLLDSAVPHACMYSAYLAHGTREFTEPAYLRSHKDEEFRRFLKIPDDFAGRTLEGCGGPPLGLLLPREVVDMVGLPRSDVFIFGEFEYLERIRAAGFSVYYTLHSVLWHPAQAIRLLRLPLRLRYLGRAGLWTEYVFYTASIWKEYYGIRNMLFFNLRRAPTKPWNKASIVYAAVVDAALKVYYGDARLKRIYYLSKAIFDGCLGNMGKRVNPF